MSEKSFNFLAKNGELVALQPDLVKKWLTHKEDKIIHCLMDDDFAGSPFESYYWAHVVEIICAASGEHKKSKVHNDLKKQFLEQDWELLGQIFHDDTSFRDLCTEKRHDFINRVISFYSEQRLYFEDPKLWKQRRVLK